MSLEAEERGKVEIYLGIASGRWHKLWYGVSHSLQRMRTFSAVLGFPHLRQKVNSKVRALFCPKWGKECGAVLPLDIDIAEVEIDVTISAPDLPRTVTRPGRLKFLWRAEALDLKLVEGLLDFNSGGGENWDAVERVRFLIISVLRSCGRHSRLISEVLLKLSVRVIERQS